MTHNLFLKCVNQARIHRHQPTEQQVISPACDSNPDGVRIGWDKRFQSREPVTTTCCGRGRHCFIFLHDRRGSACGCTRADYKLIEGHPTMATTSVDQLYPEAKNVSTQSIPRSQLRTRNASSLPTAYIPLVRRAYRAGPRNNFDVAPRVNTIARYDRLLLLRAKDTRSYHSSLPRGGRSGPPPNLASPGPMGPLIPSSYSASTDH